MLSSVTPVEENPFLYLAPPIVDVYSNKQFYNDAYRFKLSNNLPIPDHYYDIIGIPNPTPKVIATPSPIVAPIPMVEQTEAMVNKSRIPNWILVGMLMHETSSYYSKSGSIVYVNKRVGQAGERGPFQMKRICFDTISKRGETFRKLQTNMQYAEEMAIRYLIYLYDGPAHENWKTAISMYNTGPTGYKKFRQAGREYYEKIKLKGK
jgi:hypothetical protein